MSLYVARGVSCFIYGVATFTVISEGIGARPLSEFSPIKGSTRYANNMAKQMGLNKEFIVLPSDFNDWCSMGTAFVPGTAKIYCPRDTNLDQIGQFRMTRLIARVKSNDIFWQIIPIIGAVFIHYLLNSISPQGSCLAGPVIWMAASCLVDRLCKKASYLTAIRYCSKEVNQAYLEFLQETKKTGGSSQLCFIGRTIRYLVEPSLDEKIHYFQDS